MKDKISIITVVYNGISYIEKTILSIINQTYCNKEYIIIDGNSTDGTVNIIKKYEEKINYWLSEPDHGIYDAMNKGIDIATGDWIIFMNCGDFFYNLHVLDSVFTNPIPENIALISGATKVRSNWGEFILKSRPCDQLWKSFSHQSLISRIEINKRNKFNLQFKVAADYDFVYTLLLKNYSIFISDIIISDILYISSGFTATHQILFKKEILKSIISNRKNIFVFVRHYFYHGIGLIKTLISSNLEAHFPQLIDYIRTIRDSHKINEK
jgi:glycosyltransferase involved in cell wall biosynthesis